jgi:hypothetical protein
MKNFHLGKLFSILLLVLTVSACIEDEPTDSTTGNVVFKSFKIELFQTGGANDRVLAESTWEHVYRESATIAIENKADGQQYSLDYNPNDFTNPYQITLPVGDYVFSSVVEGGDFEAFLPFEVTGEFTLGSESMDIVLDATTDYGLVTVKNQYVSSAVISTGGNTPVELALLGDGSYRFIYARGGTPAKLEITESFSGTTIIRDLTIGTSNQYNFILELVKEDVNVINLLMAGPFAYEEEVILIGSAPEPEPALELVVGMAYQGGIIGYILQAGDPGYVAGETHGLIAAPSDQGEAEWGCQGTTIGGTSTALGSGAANTAAIVAGCGTAGIAARLADDLDLNGYSDWYLPSRAELEKLYLNRGAIGGFSSRRYWSSSESSSQGAWVVWFDGDDTDFYGKSLMSLVRAVRSF